MISANSFIGHALERGFDFYTGVPCSFLTPLINGVIGGTGLRYVGAASEGEAVAIAAGASGGSLFQLNPCETGQTMTAAMTALAIGSEQVRGASLAFPSLFFVGLILFLMTLGLNLIADAYVRRVRRQI